MSAQYNNYYVITGGPGVGKTTLLTELEQRGFAVVPEDARRIIQEQVAANGEGLPWKNKELYAKLMLEGGRRAYLQAQHTWPLEKTIFFDRALPDTICYMIMEGIPVTKEADRWITLCSYASPVFILPPWKEIYQTDEARKQTWAEAIQTYGMMKQTYINYGYDVVEVPKDTVANRVDFVLNFITTPLKGL